MQLIVWLAVYFETKNNKNAGISVGFELEVGRFHLFLNIILTNYLVTSFTRNFI